VAEPGAQGDAGQPGATAFSHSNTVPAGGDQGGPLGGQDFTASTNLDKIAPESWNNIALPLTEAVKIIIEELKEIKKQTGICSYTIGSVSKHVNAASTVARAECAKLETAMADQKAALIQRIDHGIRDNNKLLDLELRKPLLLQIEMTD
tara:strand:+ start:96 stop:542 length:447 start_codon:yes stop_codon:yes gene_type:complete